MPKTNTTKTKISASKKDALLLKKGTTVSYVVSRGNTGETMKKKATIMAHVPAETKLSTIINKLPKKMVAELSASAIRRIGPDSSQTNRYLVFSEDMGRFACPPASKLNQSAR